MSQKVTPYSQTISTGYSTPCVPCMGPDVVTHVRLRCGLLLAVLVQSKWRAKDCMTQSEAILGDSSLDPSKFYAHKVCKGYCTRLAVLITTVSWFIGSEPDSVQISSRPHLRAHQRS